MIEEDFNELVEYIVDLKDQYSQKIDEQSQRINDQMMIIDELCCQMRELGARVRTLTTRMENKSEFCVCNYENHSSRSERSYQVDGNRLDGRVYSSKSETKQRWQDDYDLAVDDITKNNAANDDDEENIYEAIDLLSNKSSTLPPVGKIKETDGEAEPKTIIAATRRDLIGNEDETDTTTGKATPSEKRLINKTLPREATASVIVIPNEEDSDDASLKKSQGFQDLRQLINGEEEAELRANFDRISSKVATCSLTSKEVEWTTSSPGNPDSFRRPNDSPKNTTIQSQVAASPMKIEPVETVERSSNLSQRNQIQSGIWMRSNVLS